MKRVANVLTIAVAVFVFMFFYQNTSSAHYNSMNNFLSSLAEATGRQNVAIEYKLYDDEGNNVFYKLVDFLKENKYDALSYFPVRRYDFILDQVIFLYTEHELNEFDFFKSMHGKDIDFTLDDGSYYSSFINDKSATDTIDFINSSYQKEYQPRIIIKQLQSIVSDGYNENDALIYLIGEDCDQLISDIKNSEIANYLKSEPDTGLYLVEPEELNIEAINILLILSISALIVITICDLIGEKKEITIRKLFGEKNTSIYLELIAKRFLFNWFLFLATQVLLYVFIVRDIRPIHFLLLKPLALSFGLFTVIWIVANLVSYYVLTRVGRVINLKRDSAVGFANVITLLLKVILITLMITPFINLFSEAPVVLEEYVIFRKNKDNMLNNLAIYGMSWGVASNPTKLKPTFEFFEKLDWVYHDFSANYIHEHTLQSIPEEMHQLMFVQHPYAIANANYLKDYNIRDLDGNPIDFNALEHNTLLVPEAYKDDVFPDLYYLGPDKHTVYIQDGGTFYNYYPLLPNIEMLRQDNPVILFINKLDVDMKWNRTHLSIRNEGDTEKKVNDFLVDNQMDNDIIIASMDDDYNAIVQINNRQASNFAITLCLYVLMIFIFQFQTVFVYFSESKDEVALNYLFGKTYFQRYGFLILNSSLVYSVPLLVGIGLLKVNFKSMLLYVAFGIILDFIVSTIMIRSFEKKKTLSVLKGE